MKHRLCRGKMDTLTGKHKVLRLFNAVNKEDHFVNITTEEKLKKKQKRLKI